MNHLKNNPKGIDVWIQKMQVKTYEKLGYVYFNSYGRTYNIDQDGNIIPVTFTSGNDYKDVLIDDNTNGTSFFTVGPEMKLVNSSRLEAQVEQIYLLNVPNLKPEVQHRADEELRIDILDVVSQIPFFHLDKIISGKDALKGFNTNLIDMQPYHFIKYSGKIQFQHNC